jgi:hypothetical protein
VHDWGERHHGDVNIVLRVEGPCLVEAMDGHLVLRSEPRSIAITFDQRDGCHRPALPMRSRLWSRGGLLEERLGPAVVGFAVRESDGAMLWQAVRMHVMGVPLPRAAFDLGARVHGTDGVYHFEIVARLWGVGTLISYAGVLHVQ